jgi:peptidylprolyl isomerase domain and WD repeat-containing protein 1
MADTDEQAKLAVNKRPHAAIEDEEDGALNPSRTASDSD